MLVRTHCFVPGSTLRYGSNFCILTLSPLLSNNIPIEAAVKPLPKEETTPPGDKDVFHLGVLAIMFLI